MAGVEKGGTRAMGVIRGWLGEASARGEEIKVTADLVKGVGRSRGRVGEPLRGEQKLKR